jgi:hypothetical protein
MYHKPSLIHQNLRKHTTQHTHLISRFRLVMGELVESKPVQYFIMILLILNITILAADVVVSVIAGSPKPKWALLLHETFVYVILVILGVFILEIALLLLIFGWRFFLHAMYILDLVVVVSAFVLEIIFATLVPEFLSLLRIWRILRIGELECKRI